MERLPKARGMGPAQRLPHGRHAVRVLPLRIRDLGAGRMRQLATVKIDDEGIAAVEGWIKLVTSCP
jgi:hypothetical protein